MAAPWISKVKASGKLAVFVSDAVKRGAWANAFTQAFAEFNRLAAGGKFGVTLTLASSPPDPDGLGGADVNFDLGDGRTTFKAMGQEFSVNVLGSQMHGHTQVVGFGDGNGKVTEVIKSFVFVPAAPTINSGPAGNQIVRPVGDAIRTFIAVHEFIHCAGLSNSDHSPGNVPDVFLGQPQPVSGAKPQDDKMLLFLGNPNIFAPPITVSSRTTGVIQGLWPQQP